MIEVTEDESKNDPEETESSTNQNKEVTTAKTESENESQSAQDEMNGTTENGESSTSQSDEANENSSSTNNNEDSSTSTSAESQLPSSTQEPVFSCSQSGVGRFARPENCHDYYYCWDSIHDHVTFSCKSKVFDPISKQVTLANNNKLQNINNNRY